MTTIAWFGAGLLGSGFVEAALSRKTGVRLWNRTAAKTEPLAAKGAIACATPAEAVRDVDRVHVCLSDDQSVESVLEAALPVLARGVPIVDHTTVSPAGARERAARLGAMGVAYVSAPVFMGPINARQASGRMLCAGPTPVVQSLSNALKEMTGELVVLGEDNGAACALKLVGNAMIIGVAGCLADSFALGMGAGLSAESVQQFVTGFPFAAIVAGRGARMIKGEYDPSFELSMARKDVRLMCESAAERPLAVLPGLGQRMDALIAEGHGGKDLGALSITTIPAKK
jgi:3-hydroxyisobutyrate dehydrogenase